VYTGNKWAKFHGNTLSLSENIAKRFRGATFLTHTVDILVLVDLLMFIISVDCHF